MALSSITKKLIMSISGLFLIVFLLLHMTINLFSVIDSINGTYGAADGLFAKGCEFMALPIVTIMVPVLAAGFIVHIVYALILSYGNYKARGTERYAIANKTKAEWASKNMLLLGVVVLYIVWFVALGLHLCHGFWSAFQTIGLSNKVWEKRLTYIGYVVVAIIVLGFCATAINAFCQANCCCGGCC